MPARIHFASSNFVTANKLVEQSNAEQVLGIGFATLDDLVGNFKGGQFYLFYGASGFVDDFVRQLMAKASAAVQKTFRRTTLNPSRKTLSIQL